MTLNPNLQKLIQFVWGNSVHRFIIIGCLNTIVGYGIFALSVFLGVHYALAIMLSYCFGTLFSFNTIGRFVFRSYRHRLVFRFVALYVCLYFVNVSIVKTALHFGIQVYLAGAIGTIVAAAVSYICNRYLVFRGIPH